MQPSMPATFMSAATLDVVEFSVRYGREGQPGSRRRIQLKDPRNWTVSRGEQVATCRDGHIEATHPGQYEMPDLNRQYYPVWSVWAGFWSLQLLRPTLFLCCLEDDVSWRQDEDSVSVSGKPDYQSPSQPFDGLIEDNVVYLWARIELDVGVARQVVTERDDGLRMEFALESLELSNGMRREY